MKHMIKNVGCSSEDDEFEEIFLTKRINNQWLALLI